MLSQVRVEAGSFPLVQAVWQGWMSLANDPAAMHKLEKSRAHKISSAGVREVLARYVRSCPREHQRSLSDWLKRGSLRRGRGSRGGDFPNVTLTCFSPRRRDPRHPPLDVAPRGSEEAEWASTAGPDDHMVYAPHGIDMVFQDWDFSTVAAGGGGSGSLLDMYRAYLTRVLVAAVRSLKQPGRVQLTFLRVEVRALAADPRVLRGGFDRIATGVHADLLGTPFVLQHFGGLLRSDNPYARLLTHHRVWSLCLDWHGDQQAREACARSLRSGRPPDPLLLLTGRWATFRHFLQAELLHHLHLLEGRPMAPESVPLFGAVSRAYGLQLSDYSRLLNHVVPFRFTADRRAISMVDSRLHTLEWHRASRATRSPRLKMAAAPQKQTEAQKHVVPKKQTQRDITPKKTPLPQKDATSRKTPGSQKPAEPQKTPPPPPASPPRSIDSSAHYLNTLTSMTQSAPGPVSRNRSVSPETRTSSTSSRPVQDRSAGPHTNGRPRPRSMDESPFNSSPPSPELDQALIRPRPAFSSIRPYSEIPEGISRRVRQALLGRAGKGDRPPAKSAPASPQLARRLRPVKERASIFERGAATRSTYPEARRTVMPMAASTPVRKLVSMFSRAFVKDRDKVRDGTLGSQGRPPRTQSLHEGRTETLAKSFTNSLRFPRKEASGSAGDTSTFPRRARPYSVAVSKFSYLESEDRDKSLGSQYFRKEVTDSPIRSLVSGLNTIGVSPAAPAAAAAATTPTLPLRETITVRREDLRLVNLRPGSPSPPSPVVPCLHSTDWPPTTLTPAGSSPRLSWQQGGKGAKDIPSEPKYEAPPLHGSRSPRSPHLAVWPPPNKPATSDHTDTLPRSRSHSPASPHIPVARYTPAPPKNPVPPNTPDVPRVPSSHRPSQLPLIPTFTPPRPPALDTLNANSATTSGTSLSPYDDGVTSGKGKGDEKYRLESIFSPRSSPRKEWSEAEREMAAASALCTVEVHQPQEDGGEEMEKQENNRTENEKDQEEKETGREDELVLDEEERGEEEKEEVRIDYVEEDVVKREPQTREYNRGNEEMVSGEEIVPDDDYDSKHQSGSRVEEEEQEEEEEGTQNTEILSEEQENNEKERDHEKKKEEEMETIRNTRMLDEEQENNGQEKNEEDEDEDKDQKNEHGDEQEEKKEKETNSDENKINIREEKYQEEEKNEEEIELQDEENKEKEEEQKEENNIMILREKKEKPMQETQAMEERREKKKITFENIEIPEWEQMEEEEEEEEMDGEKKEDEEEKEEEGEASMSVSLTEADMEVSELLAEPDRRGFCPIREESVAPDNKAWQGAASQSESQSVAVAPEAEARTTSVCQMVEHFSQRIQEQQTSPRSRARPASWHVGSSQPASRLGLLETVSRGGTNDITEKGNNTSSSSPSSTLDESLRKPHLDECNPSWLPGMEKGQHSRSVSLTPPPVPPRPPRPARPMSIGTWIQQDYERVSPFQDVIHSSSPAPLHSDIKDAIFDLSDDEEPVYALDHERKDLVQDGPRQEFIEKLERLESSRTLENTGDTERFFTGVLEDVVSYSVHVDTLPLFTQEAAAKMRASDQERGTARDRPPSPVPTLGAVGMRPSRMGGLDKMSFRELVKTSLAEEDARRPLSPGIVVEQSQSVGEALQANLSNQGSIEEALDALSFLAEQPEEEIDTTTMSVTRRWRLPSLHSSSDLEDEQEPEPRLWFSPQETQRNSFRLWGSLTRKGKVAGSRDGEAEGDTESKTRDRDANEATGGVSDSPVEYRVARSTAPTIISMTPKLRGSGSPAMGGRRERTPPPEPLPRRRQPSPRDSAGDPLSVSLLKLLAPLEDSSPMEETDEQPDSTPSTSSPPQTEPTAILRQGRPLTGVLKTSRDPSREARRSLRVSWGDLPEDFDNQDDDPPETSTAPPSVEERGYRVTPL
ncbi:hypothetical protein E2C01_040975 [Portunus trituberculatus]|uniref:Uncharacterized protein n=1 Tax=Portunus trituberculatus TaxID=210409 RepID=A0A5B7FS85_PORTR|nr:hypothetical protein [Portunus trituberculatus]